MQCFGFYNYFFLVPSRKVMPFSSLYLEANEIIIIWVCYITSILRLGNCAPNHCKCDITEFSFERVTEAN